MNTDFRTVKQSMNGLIHTVITAMKRATLFALVFVCPGALAAEDVWQPREASPLWQSECGSCHMAFPPALLSQGDWHILMQGLDKHFGADATLDAKSRDEIAAFLERNAGSSWVYSSDSRRITETSWFMSKHKGALRMLRKGRIKSLADCAVCHNEHGIESSQ
jgi:cytochrome c553